MWAKFTQALSKNGLLLARFLSLTLAVYLDDKIHILDFSEA